MHRSRKVTALAFAAAALLAGAACTPPVPPGPAGPEVVWQQQALTSGSAIGISRDGGTLAASGNAIAVIDPATGTVTRTIADKAEALAMSPAGDVIATSQVTYDPVRQGWFGSLMHLYETSDGSVRETMSEHAWQVWALAFSPDATMLASGDIMAETKLWDLASDTVVHSFPFQTGAVAFSPDSAQVANNGQNSYTRVWNTGTYALTRSYYPWTGEKGVAFSPDGTRIVTAGTIPGGVDGVPEGAAFAMVVKVFRASDGMLLQAIRAYDGGGQQMRAFALSPDGLYAAVSTYGDQIRFYRLSDGALVKQYETAVDDVNGLAFMPDGMRFAYVRADGAVVMATSPVAPASPLPVSAQPRVPLLPAVPQEIAGLAVSPEQVTGGQGATATVTLAGPAPAGGQDVTLTSWNAAAHLPPTVRIAEGATSADVAITTDAVTVPAEGVIRASTSVGAAADAGFTVLPPEA